MIEGNRLKFGYGDIAVSGNPFTQKIRFRQFKPPAICGDKLVGSDVEYVGEPVYVTLEDLDDYHALIDLLNDIGRVAMVFVFKGITFDFIKYNSESVRVCKTKAHEAISSYMMSFAC